MMDYLRRVLRALVDRPLSQAEELDRQAAIKARLTVVSRALSDEIGQEVEVCWDIQGNFLIIFQYERAWAAVTQWSPEDLASKSAAKAIKELLNQAAAIPPHKLHRYAVGRTVVSA